MLELTFAEQVKLVLGRKNMTIKQLAEEIEIKTGMKMSRQNLTQRLGRDNFQEKDMKMIAEILDCPFHLSILGEVVEKPVVKVVEVEEVVKVAKEEPEEVIKEVIKEVVKEPIRKEDIEPWPPYEREMTFEDMGLINEDVSKSYVGDINPYTGMEYKTNSVRVHPTRIGYVQVYNRLDHNWVDMTEWAFMGYQERQKIALGKAYEPPTYLD